MALCFSLVCTCKQEVENHNYAADIQEPKVKLGKLQCKQYEYTVQKWQVVSWDSWLESQKGSNDIVNAVLLHITVFRCVAIQVCRGDLSNAFWRGSAKLDLVISPLLEHPLRTGMSCSVYLIIDWQATQLHDSSQLFCKTCVRYKYGWSSRCLKSL